MSDRRFNQWSRRDFLATAALAGTGALLGITIEFARRRAAAGDDANQIGQHTRRLCGATIVSEELLRAEGFTDVQYVKLKLDELYKAFASGAVDISMAYAPPFIIQIDSGKPSLCLEASIPVASNSSAPTGCALFEI